MKIYKRLNIVTFYITQQNGFVRPKKLKTDCLTFEPCIRDNVDATLPLDRRHSLEIYAHHKSYKLIGMKIASSFYLTRETRPLLFYFQPLQFQTPRHV